MPNQKQTLEDNSLWFKYKTKVWMEKSPQTTVVHNIIRVLRAVRVNNFAYVSVPITSGRFLYNLKLQHPGMPLQVLMRSAIEHNYWQGYTLVEKLHKRVTCPVLYPADLTPVHQEWEQAHFQALWLNIIAEKCSEMHMSEEWEFSNGGSEEFVHAMQLKLGIPKHKELAFWNTKEDEIQGRERMRNIKVYDHKGELLSLDDGIVLIEKSLAWISANGFKAEKLEESLRLLHWTKEILEQKFYQ